MGTTAGLRVSIDTARTCLEDLQAEVEAGARCAERIYLSASGIDSRVSIHLQQAARFAALIECAGELKESIGQQRAILHELRTSLEKVRISLRKARQSRTARLVRRPESDDAT